MSTMTLLQVINEVKSMESNAMTDDANVRSGILNAINEGLNVLYSDQPWWWAAESASITVNDDGNLVLPKEATHILGVYDASGEPLNARFRQKQLDYSVEIIAKGIKTYAVDGYDSATGFPLIKMNPSGSGSYTVRYQPATEILTLDAELIPGPREVYHYTVWYARWIRLKTDEERINLRNEARASSEEHKSKLVRQNGAFASSLSHCIGV